MGVAVMMMAGRRRRRRRRLVPSTACCALSAAEARGHSSHLFLVLDGRVSPVGGGHCESPLHPNVGYPSPRQQNGAIQNSRRATTKLAGNMISKKGSRAARKRNPRRTTLGDFSPSRGALMGRGLGDKVRMTMNDEHTSWVAWCSVVAVQRGRWRFALPDQKKPETRGWNSRSTEGTCCDI
ncbi:hypothetical protein LY76DRAFT_597837 [Colletotrichum caudatum]|nr:hypothetical protein LY76DRAFT_597837 [Colletotrichum caudatum]